MHCLHKVVAFDTETTGVDGKARVIEVGIVVFEGMEITAQWNSLLYPEGVDWESSDVQKALEVNQVRREDLVGKPSFRDVLHDIVYHLQRSSIWVAHNSEFDLRMLNQEHRAHYQTDFPIQPQLCVDTMFFSNRIHPTEKRHKLGDVAARWGVVPDGAHRASSDATTCGRILQAMVAKGSLPSDLTDVAAFHRQAEAQWRSRRKSR